MRLLTDSTQESVLSTRTLRQSSCPLLDEGGWLPVLTTKSLPEEFSSVPKFMLCV